MPRQFVPVWTRHERVESGIVERGRRNRRLLELKYDHDSRDMMEMDHLKGRTVVPGGTFHG